MSTIAEFRVSAAETSLGHTFERVPDVQFELEPSVSRTVPSLWVDGVSRDDVELAFDADSSVEAYSLVTETTGRLLYDVTFAEGAPCLTEGRIEDGEGCALLACWGVDGWWQAKIRVRDRDHLWRIHEEFVRNDVSVDLRRVSDVATDAAEGSSLTPQQHEALEAALAHGYFEIPRGISMEELAGELGISHQALSERLRRAYGTLVEQEIQPTDREESTTGPR
ncbi:helix-turn-helix domain-containing protein [Halobacteria archaeon AArc-dxtr1]|nr:helix-turn-helix domain-containing protein [Halobacteria archaeon AArc-dxtr1]